MKNFSFLNLLVFSAAITFFSSISSSSEARDLSYKFGAGYKQVYTNGFVNKAGAKLGSEQLNGLSFSYGIARDFQVEATFAMKRNFDAFLVGPAIRYDIQRLLSESLAAWNHLNIYTQVAFLMKAGDEVKTGILLQAPYLGFEILPFESNDFAINASGGFAFDLMEENMIGFTNGMFGDVGIKYYF